MSNPQGFWSLLLGADAYSTQRAKWFYTKAEAIFNFLIKLSLLSGAIFLVFSFMSDPYFGIMQLISYLGTSVLLIIFVIFSKLLFMSVGALIRIGEILESNSQSIAPVYKSFHTPTSTLSSNTLPKVTSNNEKNESLRVEPTVTEALFIEPIVDPEKENFDKLRIEATKRITSKGHSVSMSGNYPTNRWEINYKNGRTNRINNLTELIQTANEMDT